MPKRKLDKSNRSKKNFPNQGEIATHDTSIDFQGLLSFLPNPDVVLKELNFDQRAYRNILADSHLAGTIAQRKSATKSMLWDIDRGKSKSRTAKAVKQSLENLDVYRIMSDILEAPFFGMAPLEILWKKPDESGFMNPLDIVGKPAEWFLYDTDNILRLKTRDNQIEGEEIPNFKFLNARYNPTYKNPYGDPILSKVFWPVNFKKGGYKFWVTFAEKYGSPIVVGKVPKERNKAEYQKMATMLANMIQDSAMVMPVDSDVEVLKVDKGGSSQIFKDLLQFSNSEISKAVLGQTLTTEATETGTQALGTVHQKVATDIILEDKRLIEKTFNSYIDFWLQINIGSLKDPPRFVLYHEEEVDMNLAERDKTLTDTGQIQLTQQYVDRAYGFEKGDVIVGEPVEEEEDLQAEFQESAFQDQQAVDALIDSFGPQNLQQQAQAAQAIFDLGNRTENFEEFKSGIIDIFPDVRYVEFEEKFRDSTFTSMIWGNINGSEN